MSYSDFKTIENIKDKFNIPIISGDPLFSETDEAEAGHILTEILKDNTSLALNINTEKARSELIICPVLVEVRRILNRKVSLFSGTDFNVDETLGLTGYCDFIMSSSPNQVFLEFPIVCIVEAKNETIRTGYAQCIAEMIAAKIFNERNSAEASYILGVVTTGSNWKFLKYESGSVLVDFDEYLISQVNKILGIFVETMKENVIRA
ncbi:MAG TPA: hypothetical protein ENK58_07820 [Desulfobacterales bacterium]|nr:hypothetical protein [Desulfobacterales bacterium]